ncbi:uncharacterized protein LOC106011311 [Aplysia californica]|uniref:Uncharacterized protein LOC106011311 n=1 Tax=Aplysia californica TaxID=6500 RepID=A0ABM0ZWG2_APLCA|nr:uncharacterized protein LOC106011311 [Aplysia californica]
MSDYSVTVNQQLETHRHPMPQPEDLMRRLGRGHYFTKTDLADAYNQICFGPESQKKLALSTHIGVLLQKRLLFGITWDHGYFQEIMDQLTQDLPGVAVYMEDILVSGNNAVDGGTPADPTRPVPASTSQRTTLPVREVLLCSAPRRVPRTLPFQERHCKRSKNRRHHADASTIQRVQREIFLGQVQFYSKFLPNLSTILEPLYRLTKKDTQWQ